jgi:ribosomal protein S18 acetylase RimI-like enzyme
VARAIRPDIQQRMMTEVPRPLEVPSSTGRTTLHGFQLVLGVRQLERAPEILVGRRRVLDELEGALRRTAAVGLHFTLPRRDPRVAHNGMYFAILADRSTELSRFLFARGIDSETSEYRNCAALDLYGPYARECPEAREIERRLLRIPNHPRLTKADARRIAESIDAFYMNHPEPRVSQLNKPNDAHPDSNRSMDGEVTIRAAEPADVRQLAEIHAEALPHDFLVRLGGAFLRRVFFPALLESQHSRVYVAQSKERIVGFLVTRTAMGGVLADIVRRRPFRFLCLTTARLVRSPRLWTEAAGVMAQLRQRRSQVSEPGLAELFLMAVAPHARRRGVGSALIQASIRGLKAAGMGSYRVLLHAENSAADRLYQSQGFREHALHRFQGRVWRERQLSLG